MEIHSGSFKVDCAIRLGVTQIRNGGLLLQPAFCSLYKALKSFGPHQLNWIWQGEELVKLAVEPGRYLVALNETAMDRRVKCKYQQP